MRVSGGCQEAVRRVLGGCLEGVSELSVVAACYPDLHPAISASIYWCVTRQLVLDTSWKTSKQGWLLTL